MDDDQIGGVAALIVNGAGHYLMHLRDAAEGICDPGVWSLLGGGREPGESLEDAIHRELREEIGVDLPDLARFTVTDTRTGIQVFRGLWDSAAPAVTEGIMCAWMSPEVIPRLVMSPWARAVVELDQAHARGVDAGERDRGDGEAGGYPAA